MSTQGQSNLGGQHMTKEGQPDMRFKENQQGEPYQMENLRGQGRGSNQGGSQGGSKSGRGGMEEESTGTQGQSNLGGQHITKEGQPDMRFKENQEGEPYQKEAGQKGGQARSGQGGSQGGMAEESSGTRGQSNLGGEHTTKEGNPDMRFKENQQGEPYQKEAGQKGGQVRQGESGSRSQGSQGQSSRGGQHLTREGEPDMRFKENKEVAGES